MTQNVRIRHSQGRSGHLGHSERERERNDKFCFPRVKLIAGKGSFKGQEMTPAVHRQLHEESPWRPKKEQKGKGTGEPHNQKLTEGCH